jgi:hypothetical protein
MDKKRGKKIDKKPEVQQFTPPADIWKKPKKHIKKSLIIAAVLVVLAIIILIYIFLPKGNIKTINLQDKCGVVAGNLMHTVKDLETCRVVCRSQCKAVKTEFVKSDFTEGGGNCNTCTCYCRE